MWILKNWHKILFVLILIFGYAAGTTYLLQERAVDTTTESLKQLNQHGQHVTNDLNGKWAKESMTPP